jgi:high-affinity nickel-transport protein
VARADERAAAASRVMSFAVAFAALGIAAVSAARRFSPAFDAGLEGWSFALSAGVVVLVVVAYGAAMRIALRDRVVHSA